MASLERCIELKDELMTFNSTSVSHGTVVAVHCPEKYVVSGPQIIECDNGLWVPHIPRCSESSSNTTTTTIIAVTCVASFVCIVVLALALFMLCRRNLSSSSSHLPSDSSDTKSMDLEEKMKSMNQYYASQDTVGMPVISYDNLDGKLRGNSQRGTERKLSTSSSAQADAGIEDGQKDLIY